MMELHNWIFNVRDVEVHTDDIEKMDALSLAFTAAKIGYARFILSMKDRWDTNDHRAEFEMRNRENRATQRLAEYGYTVNGSYDGKFIIEKIEKRA